MRRSLFLVFVGLIAFSNPARAQFCPGISPWVFDDVPSGDPFCGYITWAAQNGITLGCAIIDANHRLYCPNDAVTRNQMAAFVNRLGNVRVEAVGTGPGLTGGPITGIGTINLATTQLLPTTPCSNNQIARWNGTAWACGNDANSGGTVTSVSSGAGLTGGPITASGTLSILAAYQLPQGCANGQVAKSNGSGSWTCASDGNSGGTVTSVATGPGLTGGPVTSSGTIGLAASQLLPTVACANGQVPQWNGSAWACTTPGSFTGNISLPNSTGPAVGNITKPGGAFLHNFGTNNTFAGVNAGNLTTTGMANAAFGTGALQSNAGANNNTALGAFAMSVNTTGADNVGVGAVALWSNTTGTDNTAAGSAALLMNTAGNRNTAIGRSALASNTAGNNNVAVGKDAAGSNDLGTNNVAVGTGALASNHGGSDNTAVGTNALAFNLANNNSAFGHGALGVNTTGEFNTAIGRHALANFSGGFDNIALGKDAGFSLTSGNQNIYLGNFGTSTESQTMRLGSVFQLRAFIAAVYGTTTGVNNAVPVVIDGFGQLGTLNSSRKVKDDVADMGDASDVLMKLHPVTFRYKEHHGEGPLQYGLIAEEVADVAPGLVAMGRDGEVATVYYQHLAPMLLNEYQKQRRTIEAQAREIERQRVEIADVRASQAREIAALTRAVEVLMARTASDDRVAVR